MKKYKIIRKTYSRIASRDAQFNGKTEITISKGLTLQEAQKQLLQLFNRDYKKDFKQWSQVKYYDPYKTTRPLNGRRSYVFDSRYTSIEIDS